MGTALGQQQQQQYQQSQRQQESQYVDDYQQSDYAQQRPLHPTPRSYGTDPAAASRGQQGQAASPKAAPVAILKQINRHNEDGSYTYGFEGADGSFKIETKLPNGEVKGKYGFVDDGGKVRIVEYGANQYGFQPAGDGITVAPPTLYDETTGKDGLPQEDDSPQPQQQAQPPPPRIQQLLYQQQQQAQLQAQQQARQQQQQQAQYEQARPLPPSQSHTQAVYQPRPALPKQQQPIFTPAARQDLPRQSLLQRGYEGEPAPARNYNQGPVQFAPAPVQETRHNPQTRSQPAGGLLDQLEREYRLPEGGAQPLHDISFGFY